MVDPILEEGLYLTGRPQFAATQEAPAGAEKPPPVPPQRSFFAACVEDTPGKSNALLKELGIRTHPDLGFVVKRAAQAGPMREAALTYLLDNFSVYRDVYSPDHPELKVIPCTNGRLEAPLNCFLDPRVQFLGKPHVDATKLGLLDAERLGVPRNPSPNQILECLRDQRPSMETAKPLFEYLMTLLPTFPKRQRDALSSTRFVPCRIDQSEEGGLTGSGGAPSSAALRHYAPNQVFSCPKGGGKGKYDGLFPYVDFGSHQVNMFLKFVGV
jgi:hypothetical protein